MATPKPRTKLINFRVSEDEYIQLRQASEEAGARNLSDFARSAILRSFQSDAATITSIDRKVGEMYEKLLRSAV